MELGKESLSAFLDGELSPKEMESVARLLEERPDLKEWVEQQERLRKVLGGAFDAIAGRVPERLVQTAKTAPLSTKWRAKRWARAWSIRTLLPAAATALAAGLVIGFFLRPASDFVSTRAGIEARGALAQALDTRLASAGDQAGGTHIGITFRNRLGQICRTFAQTGQAGVACRQEDHWMIPVLAATPREPSGAYQMAGSSLPDLVRQAVSASIAGEPFNAKAEQAARTNGWR